VWPRSVAPFMFHLVVLGDDTEIKNQAENVYEKLTTAGYEIFYDDRNAGIGEKLHDADLLGMPYRLVISSKSIDAGGIEITHRATGLVEITALDDIITYCSHTI